MTEETVVATAPAAASAKKGKTAKPKKSIATGAKGAAHPPANKMVLEAVAKLNEKGGSSLQAIKKFIAGFYNIDAEKMAPFIRRALKKQTEAGKLTQTKGTGASGSFKLAVKAKATKAKPAGEKKVKKVTKPKSASPKKKAAAAKPKKAASPKAKKPAAPKKAASPKKSVKASPKKAAPKPKKAPAAAKPKKTPAAAKPKTPKKPKTMKAKPAAKPKATKKAAPKKQ